MTKTLIAEGTGARFGTPAMRKRWQRELADEAAQAAEPEVEEIDDTPTEIGRTGARFASRAMRRRWRHRATRTPELADPEPITEPIEAVRVEPVELWDLKSHGSAADSPNDRFSARAEETDPFPTSPHHGEFGVDLAVESLVSLTERGRRTDRGIPPEWRAVATICDRPRSLADIAAALALPLEATRMILHDMAAQARITLHTSTSCTGVPSQELLRRVLDGLRRL